MWRTLSGMKPKNHSLREYSRLGSLHKTPVRKRPSTCDASPVDRRRSREYSRRTSETSRVALPRLFCFGCCALLGAFGNTIAPAQTGDGVIPIGAARALLNVERGNSKRDSGASAAVPVNIQGVIYEKTHSVGSGGKTVNGFFLQNTAKTADRDAATSDGLWVYLGDAMQLSDGYAPAIGDEVALSGEITKHAQQTELTRPHLLRVLRSGVDLQKEAAPFEVNPPDDAEQAVTYWKSHEGMRGVLPAGALAISGRHLYGASDAEAWFMCADYPLAQRRDLYARRSFRDVHPLDNVGNGSFNDGNGYRVLLGSQGLAASTRAAKLIAPVRTFDTLKTAAVGGISYGFGKYALQVEAPLEIASGADPSQNAPPRERNSDEYSVATYNVENLYDFRDDPNDGCDFEGNAGCPGVKPPFDYVPQSAAQYEARLAALARGIVRDLHSPDVLMLQELEDQDICTSDGDAMTCGTADNADGQPDTAQELALFIRKAGGPIYRAAADRDGADARGIICGFLYRTDRVELLPAQKDDPLLGATPHLPGFASGFAINAQVSNPKALNAPLPETNDRDLEAAGKGIFTRAPQVALFRVRRSGAKPESGTVFYAIANHFSSRPNERVTQRKAQAAFLAALTQAARARDPQARVLAGGDLNVFPRPDDPLATRRHPQPSDQLAALYDAGLVNLWDTILRENPSSAYSYVYDGQAQALDHLWNTPSLRAQLSLVAAVHINADWPEEAGGRRASDHDPLLAYYAFSKPR